MELSPQRIYCRLYVQVEDANEVPNPKLAVFKRVAFAPGEEKTVTLEIPAKSLSVVEKRAGQCIQVWGRIFI